jgi:putative FmdB family regulatory protein
VPIYEFECKNCGHKFEIIMRASASKENVTCPKCQAKNPDRLMSAFSAGSGSNSGGFSAASSCGSSAFS